MCFFPMFVGKVEAPNTVLATMRALTDLRVEFRLSNVRVARLARARFKCK